MANRKTIHIKKGKGKRSNVVELAKKNFPDFEIVDDTISKPDVIYQL